MFTTARARRRFAPHYSLLVFPAILVGLGSFSPAAEWAEMLSAANSITKEEVKTFVDVLADDSFEGREAGSRGGRAAGNYLMKEFEKHGLVPAGDSKGYFQSFNGSARNILGLVEGSDEQLKQQVVVIGAHIDAWGAVADDNVSGTTSILAAARAIRAAAAAGNPPRRTIVIAGWDGEEWGLLGSTEWTEEHADRLVAGGVAYLNQDAVGGTVFGAGAAPLLGAAVREAAAAVPGEGGSLLEEWRGGEAAAEVGDLGGGSDFEPFYQRLGIPSASYGFGAPGGVYHSAYDTYRWMSRFGDPGYRNHARTAQLTAILALRLANAEVLPYDVVGLAGRLDSLWSPLGRMATAQAGSKEEDLAPLDRALEDLRAAGEELASARQRYLAGGADPATSARGNRILIGIERALAREAGPFGDGEVRSLTFASDPRNGYATLALPGIATAVREGSRERVREEVLDLAGRLGTAAGRAREAARVLGGGSPATVGPATFSAPNRRAHHHFEEVGAW